MHIRFIEIQNFRKLKSIRVDFSKQTTLFVGANNSGKTSAMVALGHFLIDSHRFSTNDFTLSNWKSINDIGIRWEQQESQTKADILTLDEWDNFLPSIDVWLEVAPNELHYVSHILPTLEWGGGILGVRLRYEPKDIQKLYKEYKVARKSVKDIVEAAKLAKNDVEYNIALWPTTLRDFLDRRHLHSQFTIRAYALDPERLLFPDDGFALPQVLPQGSEPIEGNPLKGLIRINEINAQRGFSDTDSSSRSSTEGEDGSIGGNKRKLSEQLRSYYTKHIDPSKTPETSDLEALQAIHQAQTLFDEKLKTGFRNALKELEGLGYPGMANPKLTISTEIRPIDGLNHPSALQYDVIASDTQDGTPSPRLPENYNGLGYQNLIHMVFRLMSFRDSWMQVGKAGIRAENEDDDQLFFLPPLHLVLVEEPEAHLHAQVQQVFIQKAYNILRNHDDLGNKNALSTQLVVSTHSSHIAHECEFSCLRYFRRKPSTQIGEVPTSTVVNLSEVFGEQTTTQQFVTRYLKATHCDLFFADAAILVEGPAERMLVPHLIRKYYPDLSKSYITLIEIGGSHAHRFRPLIEHLGLITLIVTDLDAAKNEKKWPKAYPARGQGLITRNPILRHWVPNKKNIDDLFDLPQENKIKYYCPNFSVYIAYQYPIRIQLSAKEVEAISYTFEDALLFDNLNLFRTLKGTGLIKRFKKALNEKDTPAVIGQALFEALKDGDKAQFALDLLYLTETENLKIPTYINEGLTWLDTQLKRKQQEILEVGKAISIIEDTMPDDTLISN